MAITTTHSRMIGDLDAGSTYLQGTIGTAANNVVQLDGTAKLPAVDGSQLTNVSSGGGKLLQAVQTSLTTQSSLTSTSLADSGHPVASLTPSSTGSRIMINYTGNWAEGAVSVLTNLMIYRQIGGGGYSALPGTMIGKQGNGVYYYLPMTINYLDSPNTTSQVDYKIYYKVSADTAYYNYVFGEGSNGNPGSHLILTEIGA